jgi:hypothetical protein
LVAPATTCCCGQGEKPGRARGVFIRVSPAARGCQCMHASSSSSTAGSLLINQAHNTHTQATAARGSIVRRAPPAADHSPHLQIPACSRGRPAGMWDRCSCIADCQGQAASAALQRPGTHTAVLMVSSYCQTAAAGWPERQRTRLQLHCLPSASATAWRILAGPMIGCGEGKWVEVWWRARACWWWWCVKERGWGESQELLVVTGGCIG